MSKSPYLVRIQENTDQKKLRIWTLFTLWKSRDITIIASIILLSLNWLLLSILMPNLGEHHSSWKRATDFY